MLSTETSHQIRQTQGMLIWCVAIFLVCQGTIPRGQAAHNWTEQIAAFKPMVVNVETSSEVVFACRARNNRLNLDNFRCARFRRANFRTR